jgi:hypothetical protein
MEQSTSNAVSETIGFVIILSLILLSIGTVYTNAMPVLENAQESEHLDNTEKTFGTLQSSMNELVEEGVPRRATEIRLYDSTLTANEQLMWMNVSNGTDFVRNKTASTIIYEHEGERIVYENGAVIRSSTERSGSAMLKEPDWTVREDNGDLTVIARSVRVISSGSLSGDGTVLVRGKIIGKRKPLYGEVQDEKELTIRVKSEHSGAWERYFEDLADEAPGKIDVNSVGPERGEIEFDLDSGDRILYTETIISADLVG